jgi:hypothetical protein
MDGAMKKLSAVLALLFVSVCGHAQISGSSSRPLTVQNNGTSAGTVTGQRVLNFVSGCTATLTSGVFNITCSSGGVTVNGGSNIAVPNFQNGTGGNIINFVAAGSNIQASIPTDTVTNSMLQNNGTTVGGANCVLGASCTPTLDAIGSPQTNTNVSFTASAGYGYTFLGTAPASTSSGTGTAPGTLFNAMAPTGGATTGSATTAGAGGNISYTAGAGGSGSGGTNASGGAGGSINLIPGVGGAKSGSGTAGVNGQVNIGLAGTIGGILGFAGLTSGTATCTAPAVAGTATNAVVCSNGFNVPQNSGTAVNGGSTPYYAFTGDTKTGMGAVGTSTSEAGLYSNGNLIAYFGALATGMTLYSTSPIRWSDFSTFNDTYLCRASASVFEVGTTSCNALGTLNTGVINTGTSVAAGGFTAVSIGTPTQIYNTATTSSSASISATTMIANGAADRNYRFNAYVGQLAAGATCSVAGSIAINIVYTDPITGTAYTYVVPVLLSGGTAMGANVPLSTSTPTVANVGNATIQFRAKASTNVQFSTTYAQGTCSSGSPTYSIYPDLEAL